MYLSKKPKSVPNATVVVDVGASSIRVGTAVGPSTQPLVAPTPKTPQAIVDAITAMCNKLSGRLGTDFGLAIVGCPGLVDLDGYVVKALHIPLSDFDLGNLLQRSLGTKTVVMNDVRLQALGSTGDSRSMFYIGIGTSIGGALTLNGEIHTGAHSFAGEIGHTPLKFTSTRCKCGDVGCLDTICSGWSIEADLGELWWEKADPDLMHRRLEKAGEACGRSAVLAAMLLDPARITVAGRLLTNMSFASGLRQAWARRVWVKTKMVKSVDTWEYAKKGAMLYAVRLTNK